MTQTGTGSEVTTPVVTADIDGLCAVLAREAAEVAGLIRQVRDLRAPVPGLEWNVGELLSHLTAVHQAFGAALAGGEDAAFLAEVTNEEVTASDGTFKNTVARVNAMTVRTLLVSDAEQQAEAFTEAVASLVRLLDGEDAQRDVDTPWYGTDASRTVGAAAALAVNETVLHGMDLARALGVKRGYPLDAARLTAPVIMSAMLPYLLDPRAAQGVRMTFGIRLRGSQRFQVSVADGRLTVAPWRSARADVVLSMDPRAAMLLGMRRTPLLRAMATGGVFAYGPKPWLGMAFPGLFDSA